MVNSKSAVDHFCFMRLLRAGQKTRYFSDEMNVSLIIFE